jgi:recombination protein RecA
MVGDAQMGAAARMNSQGLRKLFPYMKPGGTTVFAINQTRKNIGGYGDPNVTTGGEAWAFYARTRLKTSVSKGEAGEYAIHKFAQIKANYGKRDTVTETTIVYGEGFNRIKELLEVAVDQGIINKSGSWYNYGDVKLGQGTDNVVDLLKDNLELMMEVETKIVF